MSTKIEWCDETWNPITGCSPISEGCENCYAARMANRLKGRFGYPKDDPFKPGTIHDDKFLEPSRWRKPRKVFVCSMGDLFHREVSYQKVELLLKITANAPLAEHTFMFLTKRPLEMYNIFKRWCNHYYPSRSFSDVMSMHSNWWLGVSAENQERSDERIPVLLEIPAAVRFVSVEPMLGPVRLSQEWVDYLTGWTTEPECCGNGFRYMSECCCNPEPRQVETPKLAWVIAGPETGPGARECKPEWINDLYAQCQAAGVPFFDKRKTGWIAREFPNV